MVAPTAASARCALLILGLLVAAVPAQSPPDPLALASAMKPAALLAEGRPIRLTDGRTGEPLSGASLVLFGYADMSNEVWGAIQVLRRTYAADPLLGSLAEAVRFGRKWVTDEAGRCVIPADFRGCVHIVKGDVYDQTYAAETYEAEVAVYPRTWVSAQVVHHDGTPAAGVAMSLRCNKRDLLSTSQVPCRATTDARGLLRIELPQCTMREGWLGLVSLQAAICGADDKTGMALDPARWRRGDPGPVRLQLPPVGRLRLRAVDLDGQPRTLQHADVTSVGGPNDQVRGVVFAGAAPEVLVATGRDYHVALHFPHQLGHERVVVAGPKQAGDGVDVVVDARQAPLMLTIHLLLPDGRPLDRGRVWVQELWTSVDPDGAGRIRIAPTPEQAEKLTLVTCSVQDQQRSLGAVAIAVPKQAGAFDLGRAVLAEEPVLLAGRVLDTRGRPIAGARVQRRIANAPWEYPVPATTDSEGRFVLRLLNPATQKIWVNAWHPEVGCWPQNYTLNEVPGFDVGATDVEIVLEPIAK
jgi:hypothetical protein